MNSDVDKEIEAIRIVLGALQPLAPDVRKSVIEYVFKRLGMTAYNAQDDQTADRSDTQIETVSAPPTPVHILKLKEEKQPKSAIEMAVLVAYYLSHLLPEPERKQTVDAKDLDTYFKIGEFELPAQQKFTLINAKNAGYLDSAGAGEYKLNAVGYNLVAHSMPRTGGKASTTKRRSSKAITKKKAAAKTKSPTGKKDAQKAR